MSKDEIIYMSLYDYLGRAVKNSEEGMRVADIAISKGIQPRPKLLPEELQTDKYKSVATYPLDFLDSIYKRSEQVLVCQDELMEVIGRVKDLEDKLNKLLNVTNSNVDDANDLPF